MQFGVPQASNGPLEVFLALKIAGYGQAHHPLIG
jgi:hypothetical protein